MAQFQMEDDIQMRFLDLIKRLRFKRHRQRGIPKLPTWEEEFDEPGMSELLEDVKEQAQEQLEALQDALRSQN